MYCATYLQQSHLPAAKKPVQIASQQNPVFDGVDASNKVQFWDRIVGIAAISYQFFDILDRDLVKQ